jgi:hypothetical protein
MNTERNMVGRIVDLMRARWAVPDHALTQSERSESTSGL